MDNEELVSLAYDVLKDTYKKLQQLGINNPDGEYYSKVFDLTYEIFISNEPEIKTIYDYECIWDKNPTEHEMRDLTEDEENAYIKGLNSISKEVGSGV